MKKQSTSKNDPDIPELKHEQLGVGVRGKYYKQFYAGQEVVMSDRITIDPSVCHGKPCIRGLRYPVENVLEWLASGMTTEEILSDYEDLEREDILAALSYAARLTRVQCLEGRGTAQMKAPVSRLKDPDLQKAPQALMRASEKARQLAEQTGTKFVVRKTSNSLKK